LGQGAAVLTTGNSSRAIVLLKGGVGRRTRKNAASLSTGGAV